MTTNILAMIVAAIFHIEGGTNASVPYGIMPLQQEWKASVSLQSNMVAIYKHTPTKEDKELLEFANRQVEHIKNKCRANALLTVIRNRDRWQSAGKPGCYFDFLADKYCPPSVDPVGNKNWKKNIKSRLRHKPCDCKGKDKQ